MSDIEMMDFMLRGIIKGGHGILAVEETSVFHRLRIQQDTVTDKDITFIREQLETMNDNAVEWEVPNDRARQSSRPKPIATIVALEGEAELVEVVGPVEAVVDGAVEANVAAVEANVAVVEANVAAVKANVAAVEANVAAVEANVAAVEANVVAVEANVAVVEENMVVVEANVAADVVVDVPADDGGGQGKCGEAK
ncbi:hypothetical protein BU17DRAFT_65302 [Hysterangium stoloniferum]|nr:hypothetical protein BU17DRAFT_65302 [Hysterangium stoloniferum]